MFLKNHWIYFSLLLYFVSGSLLFGQPKLVFEKDKLFCICNENKVNFKVYVGFQDSLSIQNIKPILAKKLFRSDTILLSPVLSFRLNQTYTAFCNKEKLVFKNEIDKNYSYPQVENIYPSSDTLPSNQLKFNILFSTTMSDIAYPHINLLDSDGNEIKRALLKEIPELWNEDKTALTIWIEPGRIKKGLGPNEELGEVLYKDQTYYLRISSDIRDRNGIQMNQEYLKKFVATYEDSIIPNIDDWIITSPNTMNMYKLKIDFPESMDYGSMMENLVVYNSNFGEIKGQWFFGKDERSIIFEAHTKWLKGNYTLRINSVVEDLAGNNLKRSFNHQIGNNVNEANYYEKYFFVK